MAIRRLTPFGALLAFSLLALAATCGDESDRQPPLAPGTPRSTPTATPTPLPDTIPWPEAVRLITDCDVTFVMQAHSLDVWLTLRDGSQLRTTEPRIDQVFDVVRDAVAAGCEQIPLATE